MTGRPGMGKEATTLVIGASGQVGGALLEVLDQETSLGTWRHIPLQKVAQFSLTDVIDDPGGTATWMADLSLKWVVIAAAMSQRGMPASPAWSCSDDQCGMSGVVGFDGPFPRCENPIVFNRVCFRWTSRTVR